MNALSSFRAAACYFPKRFFSNQYQASVIVSKFTDPYVNLTVGTYLTEKVGSVFGSKLLFLSSSHQGVFIGTNQNCWNECNMQAMAEDWIPLVRRDTGGGACFVDGGNRLFSFIEKNGGVIHKNYFPVVVRALNSLDLSGNTATVQGANDIVIDGKKVSGSAFTVNQKVFRHHGTILLSVDKSRLGKYLTPSKAKLESKGIKSVAARIANLTDFNPNITSEELDHAIITSFFQSAGIEDGKVMELTKDNFRTLIDDHSLYEKILKKYLSKEFLYNSNPSFTHKIENRFSFGIIEIRLTCEGNIIKGCEIFSDSLDLMFIQAIKNVFLDKEYSFDGVEQIRKELLDKIENSQRVNEFCDYLAEIF